jgi:hypothetical protein
LSTFGVQSVSPKERGVWALFLNSLIERSPQRILELEKDVGGISQKVFTEFERRWHESEAWSAIKSSISSAGVDAMNRNAALAGITSYIVDEPFINYVAHIVWPTFELPEGSDHFLTSDSPVVINAGVEAYPIYMLSIALSPRRLMIMHAMKDEFDSDFLRTVVMMHNIQMAKQAEKYLISSVELSDSAFIKYTRIVNEIL